MIRKTYGVSGLMDWTTQIKVGKGTVSVHFTGGALTAYGVTPAKYSTSNVFFQKVIEGSEQYRSGRISLLGVMEVADDVAAADAAATVAGKEREREKGGAAAEAQPAEDGAAAADGAAAEDHPCVLVVDVADKSDAIEWLKEHYPEKGYTAVKLRTKSAFDSACDECGVEFSFRV